MSPDQIYCKIIEYEISWPHNMDTFSVDDLKTLNNDIEKSAF